MFCCVSPVRRASSFGCSDCVISSTLPETTCDTSRIFVSSSAHIARSDADVSVGGGGAVVVGGGAVVGGRSAACLPPQPASASTMNA